MRNNNYRIVFTSIMLEQSAVNGGWLDCWDYDESTSQLFNQVRYGVINVEYGVVYGRYE